MVPKMRGMEAAEAQAGGDELIEDGEECGDDGAGNCGRPMRTIAADEGVDPAAGELLCGSKR